MKPKTFIDLFCGIGGFRIALESRGLKCKFSSDIDKHVADTYELNFGERPSGNIKDIDANSIPEHNVLCAGFPCQSFSVSGKQQGFMDNTRGTLFFDIVRIAKHHKPLVLFMENVKNLQVHDRGKTFNIIRESLDNIGYDFYFKVINSSSYGVATARTRVYIVCFRKDLGISSFEWPMPTFERNIIRDHLRDDLDVSNLWIKRKDLVIEKGGFELFRDNQPAVLDPIRIGRVSYGGQGDRIYDIDGPAITFSACGGGNGAKTGAYLMDNGKARRLHPLEAKSIMTFPENFRFPERMGVSQSHKQIGNSVVVKVVSLIFDRILSSLDENKD